MPSAYSCDNNHLEAVVRPGPELHQAGLLVEREVLHVNLAGALVDGWWLPLNTARVVELCLGGQRHLEVAVSATNSKRTTKKQKTRNVQVVTGKTLPMWEPHRCVVSSLNVLGTAQPRDPFVVAFQ